MKKIIIPILNTLFLAGFTGYVLSDTFLISRVYQAPSSAVVVDAAEDLEQTALSHRLENPSSADESSLDEGVVDEETDWTGNVGLSRGETVITDRSYSDETLQIEIQTYRYEDTDVHVADIQLSDPTRLQTALAYDTYGKNVTDQTSSIASDHDAILAINGDFYGTQEKGYVLRNGVLYRDTPANREDLVIYQDGSMAIVQESEVSAAQLVEAGAVQIFSFGPALIEDGVISVDEKDEVGKAMASNPRTAIGWIDSTHLMMVVSDGRTSASAGLSLRELAEFMKGLGVESAYNLDGGGSSTMVFMSEVINHPTTNGKLKERSVSDIVLLK